MKLTLINQWKCRMLGGVRVELVLLLPTPYIFVEADATRSVAIGSSIAVESSITADCAIAVDVVMTINYSVPAETIVKG